MEPKKKIIRRAEIIDEAAVYLSGLTLKEYFLDVKAFRKYWECGVKPLQLIFQDEAEHVHLPGVTCPGISYAHLAALGAYINYPDDSQPNVEAMFDSVEEGVKWMRRGCDFAGNDLFKLYVRYNETLKDYFSDREIKLGGLGHQGPLTTAVLLRGQDFFADLYEKPDETKEFLKLVTDSVVDFCKFRNRVNGLPEKGSAGLADDFAALVGPDMFEEFVTPYWNRYFAGLTYGGKHGLHCEGLCRGHLKFLEKSDIGHFQPSVSPKLNCNMLVEDLDITFDWLLAPFEIMRMKKDDIERWVGDVVHYNPSCVRTEMDRQTARTNGIEKMLQFLNAFRQYD